MYTWLEFFCGKGNATRCATWAGAVAGALDINLWVGFLDRLQKKSKRTDKKRKRRKPRKGHYKRNPLDIMTVPGLALLSLSGL